MYTEPPEMEKVVETATPSTIHATDDDMMMMMIDR